MEGYFSNIRNVKNANLNFKMLGRENQNDLTFFFFFFFILKKMISDSNECKFQKSLYLKVQGVSISTVL
jgi:hypothetical protein